MAEFYENSMKQHLRECVWGSLLAGFWVSAAEVQIHVSPAGRDGNPGTETRPLATPARALEAARSVLAGATNADVRVVFHAGIYEMAAPLVFSAADGGNAGRRVTWSAAPGARVVLSGGRSLWEWNQPRGRLWTATVPEAKTGQWFFRQLVVGDQRAVRARWPGEDGVLRLATVDNTMRKFTFNQALPSTELAGQRTELVVYQNWSVSRALVAATATDGVTTITPVGWIGHGDMTCASPGKPAFLEHARAFLDQPGEWFLDTTTGTLNYLARDGEEPPKAGVVAPVLTQLVRLEGTKEHPVRNLHFEGLRFEHTDFALPPVGYSEIQAAHYGTSTREPTYVQSVAIECIYAEGCHFENCRFAHLNNSAIGFGAGCRSNRVRGCLIEDIGGSGIMIGWRGRGRLQAGSEGNLDADWAEATDAPRGNEVAHCVIRRCGVDSRGAVGVFVAFSEGTRVLHNEIYDLPYTGVSVGYRWDTTPTTQARCVVAWNHIYDVMRTLADGGGIYTLGFQPGTVLLGNLIHNVHRSSFAQGGAPNNGFFIDEGSKGFLFASNTVYSASGGAVRFNQNRREWHTWINNFFDAEATPARILEGSRLAGPQAPYKGRLPVR